MSKEYRISTENGRQIIERLIYPRLRAEVVFRGGPSDLENIQMIDTVTDPSILARAMRETGDYLIHKSKRQDNE